MANLACRVTELEAAVGTKAPGVVVTCNAAREPVPIDAPDGAYVIFVGLIDTTDEERAPSVNLEEPLSDGVEEALAAGAVTWHRWDADARTFTSPWGLVAPGAPAAP